MLRLSFTHVQK
jgi:hypothetical protein